MKQELDGIEQAQSGSSIGWLIVLVVLLALWAGSAHVSSPVPSSPSLPSRSSGLPAKSYQDLARQDAQEAGIDPELFVRQINQESGFNPNVVSSAGAVGVAQFMPSMAARLGLDPHDPVASLRAAAQLMARYQTQYGGYDKALAAYNAGPAALQSALDRCGASWRHCLPRETQSYVSAILGGVA